MLGRPRLPWLCGNLGSFADILRKRFLDHCPHVFAEPGRFGLEVTAHCFANVHSKPFNFALWYRLHDWYW